MVGDPVPTYVTFPRIMPPLNGEPPPSYNTPTNRTSSQLPIPHHRLPPTYAAMPTPPPLTALPNELLNTDELTDHTR